MTGPPTPANPAAVLVTGGAGFIGGTLVRALLQRGDAVTVLDNLSNAEADWAEPLADRLDSPVDGRAELSGGRVDPAASPPARGRLRFVLGDVRDAETVEAVMPGHDVVAHLAASIDIAGGAGAPRLDFDGCVVATWNVCEAMRRAGVRRLWYASSGVVYGMPHRVPTPEDYGPLLPASHYAAGKLAAEAIISGFAHLGGWRALALRFGNTVGRSNHGLVHDIVVKLLRDPTALEVLGDGTAAKPYVAVDDVVSAILSADERAPDRPFAVYNGATTGTLTVRQVVVTIMSALGLDARAVAIRYTGGTSEGGGWPGDTTLVDFDASALRSLGWRPRFSAVEAVQVAALATRDRYLATGAPLVTSLERWEPVRAAR